MQSFTVHPAQAGPRSGALSSGAEQAEFVPDGFCVPAFAFGVFWLAWRRLWLALCGALIVLALLTGLGIALALHPVALWGLSVLLNFALGLEGHQLRRWTLERNGRPATAIVAARNLDEAEIRYFSGLTQRAEPAPISLQAAHVLPASFAPARNVIGVFPQPGGRS